MWQPSRWQPIATLLAGAACAFAVFVEMGKLPFDCAEAEQELQEGPLTEYSGAGWPCSSFHRPQATGGGAALSGYFPALRQGGQLESACADWRGADPRLQAAGGLLLAGIIENAMARTQFVRTHRLTRYGLGLALLALLAYLVGI